MSKTAILILAAGSSSRLGKAKQLILFKDKTLINHIAEEAKNAGAENVLVITGSQAEEIAQALQGSGTNILFNADWKQGMGTSIAAGVEALTGDHQNVIIAVCDQPFVSANIFRALMARQEETGKGIIASAYAGTLGTPVLFHKKYFRQLQALKGDKGAKKLLFVYRDDVVSVGFPQGETDIDTAYDLAALSA